MVRRFLSRHVSSYLTICPTENGNPIPTFTYFVKEARRRHPNLAYLHVAEPRFGMFTGRAIKSTESNDFIREIWRGKPYVSNCGYEREEAIEHADANEHELVSFGRHYTSNVSTIVVV